MRFAASKLQALADPQLLADPMRCIGDANSFLQGTSQTPCSQHLSFRGINHKANTTDLPRNQVSDEVQIPGHMCGLYPGIATSWFPMYKFGQEVHPDSPQTWYILHHCLPRFNHHSALLDSLQAIPCPMQTSPHFLPELLRTHQGQGRSVLPAAFSTVLMKPLK